MLKNKNKNKNVTLYLFVSDASVYAWQFNMIERLLTQQNITTICWINSASNHKKTLLFLSLLYRFDGLLSHCKLSSIENKSISLFTHIKNLQVNEFSLDHYLQTIKDKTDNSAIVLNTSDENLTDKILNETPLNIFSIFIGNNPRVVVPLTGILEFISGDKTITSGVQIERSSNKGNQIVFTSKTSIEPPSLCRTLETCLQKTAVFLARTIDNSLKNEDLLDQSFVAMTSTTSSATPPTTHPTTTTAITRQLSLGQNATLVSRYINRVSRRVLDKVTMKEQWILLLGANTVENQENQLLSSFTKIIPPKEEFWADPFIVEHENKHFLFLEVFPYERDVGHLSCMEIYDDGSYSEPKTILERPYHLSFPNVFKHEGVYYMIPETGDNKTIELYEAVSFPYEWKFKHYLMEDIRAYDVNLVLHNDLWWLFAAVAVTKECPTTEELYVYYADSPISETWIPHTNNPIVSDASTARPAGKIFEKNGGLIRPSQDCAGSYGAGINFLEILTLNKTSYKEKKINTLSADWDKRLSGVHTFNFNSKYTVSDAILKRGKRR